MSEGEAYPWVDAGPGVRRRVLAQTPEAMTVEVEFSGGAVGEAHNHPHIQTIFVASGVFEFEVEGRKQQVSAGDSLIIPSQAVHGAVCLEAGKLIDSFTPRRDDFL